ncbi:MAG: hypothetical protein NTX37_11725 [Burkholderiales bacterium]|nr:hypothetical protein [Burkholderiales bacterium]
MNSSKKTKPEVANDKDKKPKLVRDSFTIPKEEYAAIEALKIRAMTMGLAIKKSELLRAGLMALTGLSDAKLKVALVAVPTLKTGRPCAPDSAALAAPAQAEAAPQVAVASAAPATPDAPAPAAKVPAARKSRKPKAVAAAEAATALPESNPA